MHRWHRSTPVCQPRCMDRDRRALIELVGRRHTEHEMAVKPSATALTSQDASRRAWPESGCLDVWSQLRSSVEGVGFTRKHIALAWEDRGTSDYCECRAHPVSGVRTEQVAAACGSRSIRQRRWTHTGLAARPSTPSSLPSCGVWICVTLNLHPCSPWSGCLSGARKRLGGTGSSTFRQSLTRLADLTKLTIS